MNKKVDIIREIEKKAGIPGLADILTERLSGTDLNSLLLEVFAQKVKNTPAQQLLQQYLANPFVQPAETDMMGLLQLELEALAYLRDHSFRPMELSPVAQLGSCSIVGTVSQDKIISATRNTEVLADATNSLALYIAGLKRSGNRPGEEVMHFCTVHRHCRTRWLRGGRHMPHFKIGCLVSSGRNTGDYRFESAQLLLHITTLDSLLKEVFGINSCRIKIQRREGYPDTDRMLAIVVDSLKKNSNLDIFIDDGPGGNNYYKGIQFKVIIKRKDQALEIADGGFVDWTQQLLSNHKERLLISGFGLEWLYKIQTGSM